MAGIMNAWNRRYVDGDHIDVVFVFERIEKAFQKVADGRGFDYRYLRDEFIYAQWYTETLYVQQKD